MSFLTFVISDNIKYTYLSYHLHYSSPPPFGLHQGHFLFASCLPLFFFSMYLRTNLELPPKKVAKVDETKRCIYVHLFTDKSFHDPARSLNHQMAQSDLFKQRPDVFLTSHRFVLLSYWPSIYLMVPNLGALKPTRGLQSLLGVYKSFFILRGARKQLKNICAISFSYVRSTKWDF